MSSTTQSLYQSVLDHWIAVKWFTDDAPVLLLGQQQHSSSLTQFTHISLNNNNTRWWALKDSICLHNKDPCMISIVHCSYIVCECVCVCAVGEDSLHLSNGGAGVLHWLPRVRAEQERHRRVEEVRREKSKRERDEGEGGVTTTDTHAHIHSRNTVTPLPHYSHIHALVKQQILEGLVHTGLNAFKHIHGFLPYI